jgi:hypothetical protein
MGKTERELRQEVKVLRGRIEWLEREWHREKQEVLRVKLRVKRFAEELMTP